MIAILANYLYICYVYVFLYNVIYVSSLYIEIIYRERGGCRYI